jgi:ribosomal protein S19
MKKYTFSRTTVITKELLDEYEKLFVDGGSSKFTQILHLDRAMEGHRLGEYAPTKKLGRGIHDTKKKNKKKKKKN